MGQRTYRRKKVIPGTRNASSKQNPVFPHKPLDMFGSTNNTFTNTKMHKEHMYGKGGQLEIRIQYVTNTDLVN